MPPTRSISRARTVAKIGRLMKKLTMAVLPSVARGSASVGGSRRGRGSRLPVRLTGFRLFGFAARGGRARPGYADRIRRGRLGLDRQPGADQLETFHDHGLAGFEARFED